MNKYYVYAYLREDMYSPYYIGKGQGNRIHSKDRVIPPPPRHRKRYIAKNLTEQQALDLEETLITFWGRKNYDGGVLYNIQPGGTKAAPNNGEWLKDRNVQLKRTGGIIIEGKQFASMAEAARYYDVAYNTIRYWRDNNLLDTGCINRRRKDRGTPPRKHLCSGPD